MTRSGAAIRLSAYYAALFAAVGIHLPFWPLWLADKGLSPAHIGWIVAATYLVKLTVSPMVGHMADRAGQRRWLMVVLAGGAALLWLAFGMVDGFWPILAVTLLALGLWSGIMPVGESLSLAAVYAHRLDYGRVRLWGSLAFIASASVVGRLLVDHPPAILLGLVAGALALTALACAALPEDHHPKGDAKPLPVLPLLTSRPFVLFLAAASLNQAGHTVYYAFATIHWKAAGIADDTIGLLWSEGVLAEIALFAVSGPVLKRMGPGALLLAAGLAGILRWSVLGATTELPWLVAAQVLHGATFGCAHLGAMHFIQQAVPAPLSARAQGIFAAVAGGLAPGLMSPLTGGLYQSLGGHAFLVMALFGAGSAIMAWLLMRRWNPGTRLLTA